MTRPLRQSTDPFQAVIEHSLDVTAILDADGIVTYANPAFERVLGYDRNDFVGKLGFSLVHPDDTKRVEALFARSQQSPDATSVDEVRVRHRNGSWLVMESVSLNLLDDPGVAGMVVIARDITARRTLEQRLSQSERLEAVGQLAGGIAHDFNNILLVIRGYGSVLHATLTDSQHLADVAEITRAADRAAELTRQLLAFARRQATQPDTLHVPDVVRDLDSLLRRTIPEDIELELELAEDVPAVLSDASQLQQVLVNLVVNARDAMPEGGTVRIAVAECALERPDERAEPPLEAGRYVALSVADTGCGIPPEALRRIYEPFFTTKAEGIGTGLGLSQVHGIVAQNGGGIAVETAEGTGTTFTVYLPVVAGAAKPTPLAAPPERELVAGSERILLVEDEEPVRELVRRVLEQAGYEVLAAARPSEAQELLDAAPDVDLLLSDVVMPEMSGYELAVRIREARPEIRMLFMSGYAHDAAASRPEGTTLLKKPFAPDQLARAVRRVLDEPQVAEAVA